MASLNDVERWLGCQDMGKRMRFSVLACLIFLGAYVRSVDLGTHFPQIDDIGVGKTILIFKYSEPLRIEEIAYRLYEEQPQNLVTEKISQLVLKLGKSDWGLGLLNGLYRLSAVPAIWTYAPIQFIFIYFLIDSTQSYRDVLFWGRFPSCLFGILALLCLVLFYQRYDRLKTPAVFLSLAALVFSWENIVYAKQMQSYCIGVFSATALLSLLLFALQAEEISLRGVAIAASTNWTFVNRLSATYSLILRIARGSGSKTTTQPSGPTSLAKRFV